MPTLNLDAEGWAKHLLKDKCKPYSAGTEPHALNQIAVKVMGECGIDISGNQPKSLESLEDPSFELVVTVCEAAAKTCPTPPKGTRVIHAAFDDPPRLAKEAKSDEEAMQHYRRVRDEIKAFVITLPSLLSTTP